MLEPTGVAEVVGVVKVDIEAGEIKYLKSCMSWRSSPCISAYLWQKDARTLPLHLSAPIRALESLFILPALDTNPVACAVPVNAELPRPKPGHASETPCC